LQTPYPSLGREISTRFAAGFTAHRSPVTKHANSGNREVVIRRWVLNLSHPHTPGLVGRLCEPCCRHNSASVNPASAFLLRDREHFRKDCRSPTVGAHQINIVAGTRFLPRLSNGSRTPCRITATEFSDSLKYFFDVCCSLYGNTLSCIVCGTPILHVRAALSIHNSARGGCEGLEQRVWNTGVPYCPACEEKPAERGCLHFFLMIFPRSF